MSTIHNPKNFNPQDYRVIDYFDNRRPEYYFGMSINDYEFMVRQWEGELRAVYGNDFHSKIHRCVHCGQGNVRYIAACQHIPTGEVVTFGDICVHRLEIPNRDEFKSKYIRTKAQREMQAKKNAEARQAILEGNPDFAKAVDCFNEHKDTVHMRNSFARDILNKFHNYHTLSDKQVSAFTNAINRDHEWDAKRKAEDAEPKGDAPEGRVEVTGTILSIQEKDTPFGYVFKMLVKLDNNSKVYCTAPQKALDLGRGDTIKFKATFQRAKDDRHFAFGSRPYMQ